MAVAGTSTSVGGNSELGLSCLMYSKVRGVEGKLYGLNSPSQGTRSEGERGYMKGTERNEGREGWKNGDDGRKERKDKREG